MLTKYGKHCLRYFSGKAQAHEVGIFPNLFVLFGHWVDRIVQENWAQVWIKGTSKIMIKLLAWRTVSLTLLCHSSRQPQVYRWHPVVIAQPAFGPQKDWVKDVLLTKSD